LLVTFNPGLTFDPSWHVLSFGGGDSQLRLGERTLGQVQRHARHSYVVDPTRTDAALVQRTIVDQLELPPRWTWYAQNSMSGVGPTTGDLGGLVTPLVHVGSEQYVSAFVADRGHGKRLWALPASTTEPRSWLVQVLRELHLIDPDNFPAEPDWKQRTTWAPPALVLAHEELQQRRADREDLLRQAEEAIAEAEQQVQDQQAKATDGPWRLLTAQGDDLVHAVRDALVALGFTVEERDEHNYRAHGVLLEDLLVTDPGVQGWESLVEVKGYAKGAKATEVAQITGRASTVFAVEHHRAPSSVWHVVNHWRSDDPSVRADALPNSADLHVLTDNSGALIDTRHLFRAWCDVQAGTASSGDVRRSLRTARTRWIYSAPTP